jgi:hypothetical protein
VLDTALRPEFDRVAASSNDVSADPDWLHVEESEATGPVLVLTGPVVGRYAGVFTVTVWYTGSDGRPLDGTPGYLGTPGDVRTYPASFALTGRGVSAIDAELDAAGNPYWGVGGPCDLTNPTSPCDMLAVTQSDSAVYWYGTSIDQATSNQVNPPPGYPRFGDAITAVDLAETRVLWQRTLGVHSIVRVRASKAGTLFVAGLTNLGAPDVRALSSDGDPLWAASPVLAEGSIASLALAPDTLGGAVVAWNAAITPPVSIVQHFDANGALCAELRVPGTTTALVVRADRHVAVATDGAILQLSL